VDDWDLRTSKGRYLVILRNPSPGEYHGNILISFPGNVWEVDPDLEATYERKPDLPIDRLELDADNHIVITVANHGPGLLHKVRYNRDGERVIRLQVEVDGLLLSPLLNPENASNAVLRAAQRKAAIQGNLQPEIRI